MSGCRGCGLAGPLPAHPKMHSSLTLRRGLQLCPAASFTGSKNSQSHGFNVGLGVDYGVQGPWSVVAEYNDVKLSKGSNSDVNCTSTGALKGSTLCANYANFDLSNIHNSFTMSNMFRVGVHYGFHEKVPACSSRVN